MLYIKSLAKCINGVCVRVCVVCHTMPNSSGLCHTEISSCSGRKVNEMKCSLDNLHMNGLEN